MNYIPGASQLSLRDGKIIIDGRELNRVTGYEIKHDAGCAATLTVTMFVNIEPQEQLHADGSGFPPVHKHSYAFLTDSAPPSAVPPAHTHNTPRHVQVPPHNRTR